MNVSQTQEIVTPRIDLKALSVAVRTKRGVKTFRELEAVNSISWTILSKIERQAYTPGLDVYLRLCDWLEVDMNFFVTKEVPA